MSQERYYANTRHQAKWNASPHVIQRENVLMEKTLGVYPPAVSHDILVLVCMVTKNITHILNELIETSMICAFLQLTVNCKLLYMCILVLMPYLKKKQ